MYEYCDERSQQDEEEQYESEEVEMIFADDHSKEGCREVNEYEVVKETKLDRYGRESVREREGENERTNYDVSTRDKRTGTDLEEEDHV